MPDFNQRISSIRADLESLLGTLSSVDNRLKDASREFEQLASSADNISTLAEAVGRLNRFLGQNNSPLLDRLRTRVEQINTEIAQLDLQKIASTTEGLGAQAKVLEALNRAQINLNSNTRRARDIIQSISTELDTLDQKSQNAGAGLAAAIDRIRISVTDLSKITALPALTALQQADAAKFNNTAESLERIARAVQSIRDANVNINVRAPATEQGQSAPTRRSTTPRVNQRTLEYAAANDIDINSVQASGRTITKSDVHRAIIE